MELWQGWLHRVQEEEEDTIIDDLSIHYAHETASSRGFNVPALTAVESGSLARLIPSTVRSVDAVRQNGR